MPELQHYATWDEAIAMLRHVAEAHHLRLIPETPKLPEPRVDVFDGFVPSVADRLAGLRVLLLEGDFTQHPLQFGRREGGARRGPTTSTS